MNHPPFRRSSLLVLRLLSQPRVSGRRRASITVGSFLGVVLIGLLDASTGADLSLAAFYLLPVALSTIAVSTTAGVLMLVASIAAGLCADLARRTAVATPVHLANGAFRGFILLIVVALVAGLRAAHARARRSEQRSREFLAYAAHQLRTPVAGVRASAEALIIEGALPKQEPLLQRIVEESARSGRLVAALLQVARLDQGEQGELRDCDIGQLVGAEVARVRSGAPGLEVDVYVQPWLPRVIQLNPEGTREALGNLLDNARKHATKRISVSVEATDGEMHIRVRDDGAGLAPGDEKRVFRRFVTLDGLGGSGLGLPIARGLTESQGGQLGLEEGAFVMTLPLHPAGTPTSDAGRTPSRP